jgi:hypothetical protein
MSGQCFISFMILSATLLAFIYILLLSSSLAKSSWSYSLFLSSGSLSASRICLFLRLSLFIKSSQVSLAMQFSKLSTRRLFPKLKTICNCAPFESSVAVGFTYLFPALYKCIFLIENKILFQFKVFVFKVFYTADAFFVSYLEYIKVFKIIHLI